MKCKYCGYESPEQFAFCPCCGNAVTDTADQLCVEREEPKCNPAANRILGILKDKLFLIICIMVTAGAVGGILSDSFNIIYILASVFLWLLYAQVKKDTLDSTQLKNLSGTVYASYIVTNIACIMLVVCGLIVGVVMALFGNDIMAEITDLIEYEPYELVLSASTVFLAIIIVVVLIAVAVIGLLINIFGMRNIHKFAKSVYQSIESGELKPVKCRTAHNWLMIFGVLGALGAVGSFINLDILAFIADGGIAAAEIMAAVLINKNLSDFE